jgi:hypothetical protein
MNAKIREYKNPFTLDDRLRPAGNGVPKGVVTEKKVAAVQDLIEGYNRGDFRATANLMEALTTSDAVFNAAYLATLNFVDNYDLYDRSWEDIAGTRTVNDFRPATLYSLNRSWTDGNGSTQVLDSHGAAPVIPEGTAYPYAYIAGDVTQGASVTKKGFKTDWTLEARINDGLGALDRLPDEMLLVASDTESAEVWGALVNQKTAASNYLTVTIPDPLGGTNIVVPPNAPLSRNGILGAIQQLGLRTVNGRRIQVKGNAFNLIVPIGTGLFAEYILSQVLTGITTGAATTLVGQYDVTRPNPLAGITVKESEWVTGTQWYLVPKKGSTVRPILERLELRGYTTPQLFVDNHVGTFVGAGAVSPFEGSFAADVITLKLRQFGGGVLWDQGIGIVYSNGSGS